MLLAYDSAVRSYIQSSRPRTNVRVALFNQVANQSSRNSPRWWYYSIDNHGDFELSDKVCQRFVTAAQMGNIDNTFFDEIVEVSSTFGRWAKCYPFHFTR